MFHMDETEFGALWAVLVAMWPRRFAGDDGTLREVWRGYVIQHPFDRVRRAVRQYGQENSNPPMPANILESVRLTAAEQYALKAAPAETCDECEHGWIHQLDGAVKPCRRCRPTVTLSSAPSVPQHRGDPVAARAHADRLRETLARRAS